MAVLTAIAYARTRVRRGRTGQRVRLVSVITAQAGSVFNLTQEWGLYSRVSNHSGGITFSHSNYPTPPFEHSTPVAATHTCTEPRFCWDATRRTLILILNDNGSIVDRNSYDDGYTWSSQTVRFSGASHPDITCDRTGLIVRSCYLAGALRATRQAPGDASPGSAFDVEDDAGSPLALADDTFRIVGAPDGRHWLHARLSGDTESTILFSTDDSGSYVVTSGAVTGIAGATRPGLAAAADGTLYAFAHVAGEIALTRRAPGDTAWSTPVIVEDDAGNDLQIEEQSFSMAVAFEGPRRLLLTCVLAGDTTPTELWSSDEGETFAVWASV